MKHPRIIGSLIGLLLLILSIHACLFWADPLGAFRLDNDLRRLYAGYVASPRGYALYPGHYEFSHWSANIGDDHNRVTPDSRPSDCTIAFLGDSVTFGYGVNDADTFANLIAQQLDVHIVNTALLLYNIVNVRMTLADTEADGYVYVIIWNDDGATKYWISHQRVEPVLNGDVFGAYASAFNQLYGVIQHDLPSWRSDLDALRSRDDVLLVAFKDPTGWYKRLPRDVIILPLWAYPVSFADGHPNPEGHREIAGNLLTYVREFTNRICQK